VKFRSPEQFDNFMCTILETGKISTFEFFFNSSV